MATISNSAVVIPSAPPPQASQDIRDIKPPLQIADGWTWVWWTLGILVVLLAAWMIYRWLKKKADQPTVIAVTPPHVIAKQRLQQALSLLSDPKTFCTAVSDAIRVYLEDRFQFRAPERTTEEFLLELQDTQLLMPDQKTSLSGFLESCDLVKFAKHEPHETDLRDLHEAACRLVDETQFDAVAKPGELSRAQGHDAPPPPPPALGPETMVNSPEPSETIPRP